MIINLNEKWRINSDAHNWILQRKPEKNPRRERKTAPWINHGYFRNLGNLIDALIEYRMKLADIETGPDALSVLTRMDKAIRVDIETIKADPRLRK